jgi:hypothetical protein
VTSEAAVSNVVVAGGNAGRGDEAVSKAYEEVLSWIRGEGWA